MAMTLYAVAIAIHVVTAILGLGQLAGIVVLASATSGQIPVGDGGWTSLGRLARGTRASAIVMLLSGVLLEYAANGAFHEQWWFRLSFAGLLAIGVINARMCSALGKRASVGDRRTLKGVLQGAITMCTLTAAIAVLMELKPW
jgi:hypothetical protein